MWQEHLRPRHGSEQSFYQGAASPESTANVKRRIKRIENDREFWGDIVMQRTAEKGSNIGKHETRDHVQDVKRRMEEVM